MRSYKQKIGARIRKERISRNISIEELAEMMQLSSAFIGLIERGNRGVKIDNLVKFAEIFNLTVNDFVYDKKPTAEVREPRHVTKIKNKQAALTTAVQGLSSKHLDILIQMAKGLKNLTKPDFDDDNDYGEYEHEPE